MSEDYQTIINSSTYCIAIVHSHISVNGTNVVDLSPDLISVQTGKTVKSIGNASLKLVARKNYLNYLFPNDIINIYFNTGDGKGWVRTFFGYIDCIERTESVDSSGTMITSFTVSCSDFTKAFDNTTIICRPEQTGRVDRVDSKYQNYNLAGGGLRESKGLTAAGSPGVVVETTLNAVMGDSDQFILPPNYIDEETYTKNRTTRLNRLKSFFNKDQLSAINIVFGTELEDIDFNKYSDRTINGIIGEKEAEFAKFGKDPSKLTKDQADKQAAIEKIRSAQGILQGYFSIKKAQNSKQPTLVDLIDFSFIETLCLDGYIANINIWSQSELTGLSLVYQHCNEYINEVIFDLRPVAVGPDSCLGYGNSQYTDQFDNSSDGVMGGINIKGFNSSTNGGINSFDLNSSGPKGIKYVPAVIMREYPFSTADSVDLSNIYVGDYTKGNEIGRVALAGIFSSAPTNSTKPLRVFYDYNSIGFPQGIMVGSDVNQVDSGAKPIKHLDVVQITNADVFGSTLKRSDVDTFNAMDILPDDNPQMQERFSVKEILPIYTPISISRNGLRFREYTTRYNKFDQEKDEKANARLRHNVVRWALLLDHWNQHNIEFLNGTISTRGLPHIRVGYRLDWADRQESYYVEGVSHSWAFQGIMRTELIVSRGQNNNPFPIYIEPSLKPENFVVVNESKFTNLDSDFNLEISETEENFTRYKGLLNKLDEKITFKKNDRSGNGRLSKYFKVKDNRSIISSYLSTTSDKIKNPDDEGTK